MILTEQLLLVCQGPTCEEPTMDWIRIFKVEDTKYILPKKTPKNFQNKLKSIYKKKEKSKCFFFLNKKNLNKTNIFC